MYEGLFLNSLLCSKLVKSSNKNMGMSPVNLVSQRGLTSQRWLEKAYVGVSHMKLFNCRLLSQCVTGTAVTKFIF